MAKQKLKDYLITLLVGIALGISCGVAGTLFSYSISKVTAIRIQFGTLICFLPLAGLLIALIYRRLSVRGVGTNQVIEAADGKDKLPPLTAVAVFVSSVISHLFGASVGREGAALQIGGGIATAYGKLFKQNDLQKQILVRAGMAGIFSAVFGTPLTAVFFALEIVCVGGIHLMSVLPCLISSFSAFLVAKLLGASGERFHLAALPDFSVSLLWQIGLLTLLCVILGIVFSYALNFSKKAFEKLIKNDFLRIFAGGVLVVILTAVVGYQDYNGVGVEIIEGVFENMSVSPNAFWLKLIFTCISTGCGYKGGEIVPTLFIGATFGALIASLIGLSAPLGAAIGMVALFCCVTNCPLASLFLSAEMFSLAGFWYLLPVVAVTFAISGKSSLYTGQKRVILNFL